MKNINRVFNATRGKWVKIICKDEPAPKTTADLARAFNEIVRGPVPRANLEREDFRGRQSHA
jgi:hypothetical protein